MATVTETLNTNDLTIMIDNYDSFTYNIVQYLAELGANIIVYRNDEITIEQLIQLKPTRIIISPGPGCPTEAGISKAVIEYFAGKIPILGICLGHQSIIEVFGGEIIRAPHIMHGKMSRMYHDNQGIFYALHNDRQRFVPSPKISSSTDQTFNNSFYATRYHSLVGNPQKFPSSLLITSYCEENKQASNVGVSVGNTTKVEESKENSLPQTATTSSSVSTTSLVSKTIMGVRHREFCIEGVQFHPESITSEYGKKLLWNFLQQTNGKWE